MQMREHHTIHLAVGNYDPILRCLCTTIGDLAEAVLVHECLSYEENRPSLG